MRLGLAAVLAVLIFSAVLCDASQQAGPGSSQAPPAPPLLESPGISAEWLPQAAQLGGQPPSVLLVVWDDVGFGDITPANAPRLFGLAARGVAYANARACPTCSPSRRGLYFSQWWTRESGDPCGPGATGEEPPAGSPSLFNLFPGAVGFFGKWHVGGSPTGAPWPGTPLEHGVDWARFMPSNVKFCGGVSYRSWPYADGTSSTILSTYAPDVFRDELLSWTGSTSGARLVVWTTPLAHEPFHWPPSNDLPPGYPTIGFGVRARFEAMIAAADYQLGQVLDSIDQTKWLVVVVGDNGTPPDVAPIPSRAKGTSFEGGIHVPLVAAGPGVPHGYTSTRLVHVVDLLPSLIEYAGGTVPAGLAGLSLYSAATHPYVLCGVTSGTIVAPNVCAVGPRYKLMRVSGVESFFDLQTDPLELVDRIADPLLAGEVTAARTWLDANAPPP